MFADFLKLFGMAASWGGYDSPALIAALERLVQHSHYLQPCVPVVRLHVGLEDASD